MDSEHVVSGSKGGKNSLTPLTVECCKSLETKTQENVIDSLMAISDVNVALHLKNIVLFYIGIKNTNCETVLRFAYLFLSFSWKMCTFFSLFSMQVG